VDASFKVDFSAYEEENELNSFGNKISGNGILSGNSIKTQRT
jgi:hypothetical protein